MAWKPRPKDLWARATTSYPTECSWPNSATVSSFSSGALPPTSLITAAYIPASPRAEATPPTEAGPLARTARSFGSDSSTVGSAACPLKAMDVSVCGPDSCAASRSDCPAVGSIGCVVRKRGSRETGRPR